MKTQTSYKKQRLTSHLTKAELLGYIFDQYKKDKSKIRTHLEICGQCVQKFKLMQSLRQRVMWYLSFNLERKPMKGLTRKLINTINKAPRKGLLCHQRTCLTEKTIYGYVDGTLEAFYPEEYKSAESHLLTCDNCLRKVYSFWKNYKKSLQAKDQEIHPELLQKSLNNISYILRKYKDIELPKPPQIKFKRTQHKLVILKTLLTPPS